jgi:hypothetical protein
MADNTKDVIALARADCSEGNEQIHIYDNAAVRQMSGGCFVEAWVWLENVYIEEDD